MKVKKQELEELTVDAAKVGIVTLALLAKTGCPVPEIYEFVEKFTVKVDNLREGLELKRLTPKEIGEGLLSKGIAEKIAELEAMGDFGFDDKKRSIGFQIPKTDPSKMN